jgi:hypothetical protein
MVLQMSDTPHNRAMMNHARAKLEEIVHTVEGHGVMKVEEITIASLKATSSLSSGKSSHTAGGKESNANVQ